jgi:hypothetical protein
MRSAVGVSVIVLGVATAGAEDLEPTTRADDSAGVGAMLPLVQSPGIDASVIKLSGLYDGARGTTSYALDGQASISSLVALAAGAELEGDEVSSEVGLQLQALRADDHGVDLQVAAGYSEHGINAVHAAFAEVGIGRHALGGYAFATSRFELGFEDDERGAELGLGSMFAIAPAIHAGAYADLSLDLHAGTEPMDESSWSLQAGPAATYVVDRYAVTASGGVAVDAPRIGARNTGAFGSVGVATAF